MVLHMEDRMKADDITGVCVGGGGWSGINKDRGVQIVFAA